MSGVVAFVSDQLIEVLRGSRLMACSTLREYRRSLIPEAFERSSGASLPDRHARLEEATGDFIENVTDRLPWRDPPQCYEQLKKYRCLSGYLGYGPEEISSRMFAVASSTVVVGESSASATSEMQSAGTSTRSEVGTVEGGVSGHGTLLPAPNPTFLVHLSWTQSPTLMPSGV